MISWPRPEVHRWKTSTAVNLNALLPQQAVWRESREMNSIYCADTTHDPYTSHTVRHSPATRTRSQRKANNKDWMGLGGGGQGRVEGEQWKKTVYVYVIWRLKDQCGLLAGSMGVFKQKEPGMSAVVAAFLSETLVSPQRLTQNAVHLVSLCSTQELSPLQWLWFH